MILSCGQKVVDRQGKLIFKKASDSNDRVVGATINGKKEGLWISYDDCGKVLSYNTYINDSLTGESIGCFEDGTISSKGALINGQRDGEWILYYSKNKVAEKGNYKNGNKIGVWEYYLEDGRLNQKIEYSDKGKKVILDNHFLPPTPDNMEPLSIKDSNNNAIVQ